jgi:hypothetical protein
VTVTLEVTVTCSAGIILILSKKLSEKVKYEQDDVA